MSSFTYIPAYIGNYTKNRAAQGGSIKKITIHHMAGSLTVELLGQLWQTKGRKGSSHYGVNGDNIAQYVKEEDVAWTDGNWTSNIESITIETANSGGAPNWPVADNTLNTLISLVADIAARNKLGKLVVGQNLTYHSQYAATACPGPYLKGKMQYIADEVNKRLSADKEDETMPMSTEPVKMWFGPMSGGDNNRFAAKLSALGIAYDEAEGKLITRAAVSPGDQEALMRLAVEIGNIGYGPVSQSGGISQAEYGAAVNAKADAERKAAEAVQQAAAAKAQAEREKQRADAAESVLAGAKVYRVLEG